MYSNLPYRTICIGNNNKKRRVGKPWWTNELSELWNRLCSAERKWINCHLRSEKARFKVEYVSVRKKFDRKVQRAKRLHWYRFQHDLMQECSDNSTEFWRTIGKVGIGKTRKRHIPMEVILRDGTVSRDPVSVLDKWKQADDSDEGQSTDSNNIPTYPIFNEHFLIFELKKALDNSKKGKACGVDEIPSEVLCNDTSVSFLHVLFNICFDRGIIPSLWNKCIINPIPKSSTTDPRDPLSYRDIALASSMYKLYCSILNNRVGSWCEQNVKIVDEQNGFRKNRSTTDHISSLTNIIETRKKLKLYMYCAFIEFRKAYDCK